MYFMGRNLSAGLLYALNLKTYKKTPTHTRTYGRTQGHQVILLSVQCHVHGLDKQTVFKRKKETSNYRKRIELIKAHIAHKAYM